MKSYIYIAILAFLVGATIPFLLSIFAMTVSFKIGVAVSEIAVPLSSVDGISDSVIKIGNGIIYAGVSVICVFLFGRMKNL